MLFLRRMLLLVPWVRRARERELAKELRTHLELAAEAARADGMADGAAREAARHESTDLRRAAEDVRDVWSFRSLERLRQDFRYALRAARRSPGFTVITIASTAGGIASATLVFSLIQSVLLEPLPYRHSERLVYVREVVPALAHLYPIIPVNLQHFRTWKREARGFESLAAVNPETVTLSGTSEPERVDILNASADLFSVLGLRPQIGRAIAADDDARRSRVAIVSYSLWQRRFGGAADILDRSLLLDGVPHTIIGVLPASFWFPTGSDLGPLHQLGKRIDVIRPMSVSTWLSEGWAGDYDHIVFGRLRDGTSPTLAAAELDSIEKRIVGEHQGVSEGLHVRVDPLQEAITAPVRTSLYLLLLFVLVLLAIVCVNLAALLLARTMGRAREFSIRTAIGAGRARLFQQVLLETLLLVSAGGALGIAAASSGLRAIAASSVLDLPRGASVQMDARVVQFAVLLVFACALAVAWLPALQMARSEPHLLLRTAGASTANSRTLRLRGCLVGAESALSTVLLIGAGLLIASLTRVLHVERGFTVERAVSTRLTISEVRYPSVAERNAFFERTLDELRRIPGVTSAALISGLPLTGESQVNGIEAEGANGQAVDPVTREPIMVNVRFVSPDYFHTLGIPLKSGRRIEWGDRTRHVTVISQQLAETLWPGRGPIGRRFSTGSEVGKVEVVGSVGDVRNGSLEGPVTPIVYVPFWVRGPLTADVVVRTNLDDRAIAPEIRRAVWAADPGVPLSAVRTISDIVSDAVARRRFQVQVAGAFAAAALLLILLGIYGVVAYTATERRREIGIRMALGARQRDVLTDMIRGGLQPVTVGIGAGLLVAMAGGRFIRALLFGITPGDPTVIAAAVTLIGIAALIATLLPARAAARVNPLQVLRMD